MPQTAEHTCSYATADDLMRARFPHPDTEDDWGVPDTSKAIELMSGYVLSRASGSSLTATDSSPKGGQRSKR